jgi:hypothetical protein
VRGTHVELKGCAIEVQFVDSSDEHDRPVLTLAFFDEGLKQYCSVRVANPTYALFDSDEARAEFERLLAEGSDAGGSDR